MLRILLLLAVVAVVSCQTNCPEGWQHFQQSCFQLIDEPLDWVSASEYCVENSLYNYGHLATVHSLQENEFLAHIVLKGITRRTWIGLNKRNKEGVFVWHAHNREPYLPEQAFWKNGEPNNGGESGQEEDCVEMNRGKLGRWNDVKCKKSLPFICEVELFTLLKGGRGNKAGLPKADPRFEA